MARENLYSLVIVDNTVVASSLLRILTALEASRNWKVIAIAITNDIKVDLVDKKVKIKQKAFASCKLTIHPTAKYSKAAPSKNPEPAAPYRTPHSHHAAPRWL